MADNLGRTKKFVYNSVAMALQQVITMLTGLILPRVMLICYGSEINGLVSSISQFIAYFNLVEAGLSSATIYALYKPLADNDHKAISGVVVASKRFYMQAGCIFTGLTAALSVLYPLFIQSEVLSYYEIVVLVVILGFSGALDFFTLSKYRTLLTADQKSYVLSLTSILSTLIRTVVTIILAVYGFGIVTVKFFALFSVFARSAILLVYCKKNYTYINYKEKANTSALNKRWDALYLQILGSVQSGAPVVLLTLFLKDLKMVSVYSVFNMVMSGLDGVLGIFTSGLSASFGDVIARNETDTLKKTYKEFEYAYYILITIIYSITLATIMPFIRIYTANITDANYDLPLVGFLFTLNGVFYCIKTPPGMIVISAGMYKETRWRTTIQALILVIVGSVLTPFIGIYGVLVGSICSNIYRDIDLLIFTPRRIVKTSVLHGFWRALRVLIGIALVTIPFLLIPYEPTSLFTWVLYACEVGIFAVVVVFILNTLFEKNEMIHVLKRLKSMVKR
ncbi:lipopolysaccharide biosynthesis protein [Eubacterium sp. ER2]|uniref:lipopolysaccharide biosynthesis protein n=1 Tax=Eubacterium sp. ER2 TaxID=1519438 RepID=UPI00051BE859|nr:hypothetical protein [Eubacterium sp. ER2]